MTNWRARARIWAFAGVAGLVLTGCADGADGDAGPAGSDTAEPDDGEDASPLAEFLGGQGPFVSGQAGGGMVMRADAASELSEEDRQKMRDVQDLVASCMNDAGFEYVPVSSDAEGPAEFEDAFALDPDEFAEQYGYGISTMALEGPESDQPTDPNQEIREGLSAAAQEAYDKALWGDMAGSSGPNGVTIAKPRPGAAPEGSTSTQASESGCQTKAAEEIYGKADEVAGPDLSAFDGLFDDLGALYERVNNDPRVIEAQRAWADCMAAAGFGDFGAPDEARESVFSRMNELYGDGDGDDAEDGGSGQSIRIGGGPKDIDPAELEEVRTYELDVAGADHDCQQDGYADLLQDVSFELETQFVEEHRAELERYREELGEGPVGAAGGVA